MATQSLITPNFSLSLGESLLKSVIKEANRKAQVSVGPLKSYVQKHDANRVSLSKIFALETWRRRQHENIIHHLEDLSESLEAKLTRTMKEHASVLEDKSSTEKELVACRAELNAIQLRIVVLQQSNNELRHQTESLVASLVSLTTENKDLRDNQAKLERDLQQAEENLLIQKTQQASTVVKTEKVILKTRLPPLKSSELVELATVCQPKRSDKKRDHVEPGARTNRSRRLASNKTTPTVEDEEVTLDNSQLKPTRGTRRALSSHATKGNLEATTGTAIPESVSQDNFTNRDKEKSLFPTIDIISSSSRNNIIISRNEDKIKQSNCFPRSTAIRSRTARRLGDTAPGLDSTMLETRTPLRDRLRSRTKKN